MILANAEKRKNQILQDIQEDQSEVYSSKLAVILPFDSLVFEERQRNPAEKNRREGLDAPRNEIFAEAEG